jgi:CheY-like chemotaxis protein
VPLFLPEALLLQRRKRKFFRLAAARERSAMRKRPLILCVDDEWNGLEGRKMLFEERGYQVLVTSNGAEALQLFASHPVDLVLLDYHMPEMNGDVLAERMKARRPELPIAILSADVGLPANALKSLEAFISKSESPANLLLIVEHLLEARFPIAASDGSEIEQQRAA